MGQLEKRGFLLSRSRGKIMVDVNADESIGRKERRRCWGDLQLHHHLDFLTESGGNGKCAECRE